MPLTNLKICSVSSQNSFHSEVVGLLKNLRYDKERKRNVTKKKKLGVEPGKSIGNGNEGNEYKA